MTQGTAALGTPYRPNTTADSLALRLRTRMFDGSFVPGEALSIRRLAEAEGISVIPARDALRGLVAEGALAFRDSRTIVVPRLDPGTVDEIAYARGAVEGELAYRAFPALRARAAEIEDIDARVTAALTSRDVAGYMAANRAFHFAVYRAAAAPVLEDLAEALWLRFGPSMRIVCDALDGRLPGTDFHRVAIRALGADDRDGFRAAIVEDIAQGMDLIRRHAEPAAASGRNERDDT